MSIAAPYACSDHVEPPVIARQLNADVLSASTDASSLPPYRSTGTMRRIGKRAAYSRSKTSTTAAATSRRTTMVPTCDAPSNPTYRSDNIRSSPGRTGHPGRHDAGSCPAPTSAMFDGCAVRVACGRGAVVGTVVLAVVVSVAVVVVAAVAAVVVVTGSVVRDVVVRASVARG